MTARRIVNCEEHGAVTALILMGAELMTQVWEKGAQDTQKKTQNKLQVVQEKQTGTAELLILDFILKTPCCLHFLVPGLTDPGFVSM